MFTELLMLVDLWFVLLLFCLLVLVVCVACMLVFCIICVMICFGCLIRYRFANLSLFVFLCWFLFAVCWLNVVFALVILLVCYVLVCYCWRFCVGYCSFACSGFVGVWLYCCGLLFGFCCLAWFGQTVGLL